ncbi:HLA class II histocompatibility antigen, DQ beta 2 chain-like [Saimiri boliviensis]|uniref:HLA class II histocompatibility antigen, DQ beta 2 chain-like n=1 Tax=Saimiri boliviensis TaxID=27679 RepID=UPI00193E69F2|nr:HLA class II histocompatibility antigen, DQ beta 2 chain-like [Saimiri boliviensis boliviensis]
MVLQLRRGFRAAAVTLMLVMLSTPVAEGRDSPEDFVVQFKGMCYFTNGTERVRGVARYIYNREEYARFDSDVGEFRAVTELGRSTEDWNNYKDFLEQERAAVYTVCRHNYEAELRTTLRRRGERRCPSAELTLGECPSLSGQRGAARPQGWSPGPPQGTGRWQGLGDWG